MRWDLTLAVGIEDNAESKGKSYPWQLVVLEGVSLYDACSTLDRCARVCIPHLTSMYTILLAGISVAQGTRRRGLFGR